MWPTTKQKVSISIEIEIIEYFDNPVPFFEARCKKLNIISGGKTPEEAKDNLLKEIKKTNFHSSK